MSDKKILANHCYICNGEMKYLLKGIDINYTCTLKKFDIYKCKKCGLEQVYPLLSQDELLKYYPKNYYSYDNKEKLSLFDKIIYTTLDHVMNNKFSFFSVFFKSRIGKYPSKKGNNSNYLDIGCGAGTHLKILAKYGRNTYGFEIGEKAEKNNIFYDMHIKNVDRFDLKFDYISLWAVFEHLLDPVGYLATVKKILKDDGELHLFVPNNNSVYAKLFGPYWFNRDIPRHVFNYNPKSLKLLLGKEGFKIKNIYHLSGGGFFASLYQYLYYKFNVKLLFLNNTMLHIIFFPLDIIINLLGFGDNIHISIIKK